MVDRERDILERAVLTVAEQAAKADALVDEVLAARVDRFDSIAISAKMLRLELLDVKSALERELGLLVLSCRDCGRDVHWVAGLGVSPGHWAHSEPAPHGAPAVSSSSSPEAPSTRV